MSQKTVLVCGGAGYIGSHIVKALIKSGYAPVVVDNLSTGHRAAIPETLPFVQADVRDKAAMVRVLSEHKPIAVMHFCADSLVGVSVKDPLKYYDNNVGGAIALLQAMVECGVKKLVFSSTAAVYGMPDKTPIEEDDPTLPANPYGETKLAIERMLKWSDAAYGLKYVTLRYFNACGADESGTIGEAHEPETHLIPNVLKVPLGQREKISIFGEDYKTRDGTCVRDYIHVTDLADAHVRALAYLEGGNDQSQTLNLGSGTGFTVKEIVEMARDVTGHPIPAEIGPRRGGDPDELIASHARARQVLGWEPQFMNVRDCVASAWKWHKTHPNMYKS